MYTIQIKHHVKSGLFHFSMEDTEVNENNEYLNISLEMNIDNRS